MRAQEKHLDNYTVAGVAREEDVSNSPLAVTA